MSAFAGVAAVLFDLGGTVLEIRHDAIASILAQHGAAPAPGWEARAERQGRVRMEAAHAAGADRAVVWRAFFEGMMESTGTPEALWGPVFEDVASHNREFHLWERELPGMGDALRELKARGYRVAAISNSDGRAPALLERLGLADRFELVIDSHLVGVEKPDPRIFHLACEQLRLAPVQCAYVGDVSVFDAEGAHAAGLVPVLFDAYGSYAHAPTGGARVTGPAELLALFPGTGTGRPA